MLAALYPTLLHQKDGVRHHLACFSMLHSFLARYVVNGSIRFLQDSLCLLCEIANVPLHYRDSVHACLMETTPSWASAARYTRLYKLFTQPLVFFYDEAIDITCPELWSLCLCAACFSFVVFRDMCGVAQLKTAIYCHNGMHCTAICVG